jgi:hypothetical protein
MATYFTLKTGARIPSVGLGTYKAGPGVVGDAIATAVKVPLSPQTHFLILALFAWLISHQPTVLFSQNKPATSNQPEPASSTLLSEQTSTSHQPPANRTGWLALAPHPISLFRVRFAQKHALHACCAAA